MGLSVALPETLKGITGAGKEVLLCNLFLKDCRQVLLLRLKSSSATCAGVCDVCACMCMCVCVHVYMWMCVYVNVYMCMCVHVCMYMCVFVCICVYVYVC